MITILHPRTTTERTRDFVSDWLSGAPVISARRRPEWQFTDEQEHARAKQEAAMRAERLRGLPSCFGPLE